MAGKEKAAKGDEKPEEVKEEKPKTAEEKPKEEKKTVEPEAPSINPTGSTKPAAEEKEEEIEPELTNEFKLPKAGEQSPMHHKNWKKLWVGALIVLALAIFGGVALWLTHDTPVNESSEIVYSQGAAITAVEGDVQYNAGDGWMAVEPGTNLSQGDQVRTLKASRTIITLDEGSAVRLDSDTTVTLTKLETDKVTVANNSGHVYARVVPSETRLFVVTVDGDEYQAMGTAYVTLNEEKEKGVQVFHSKVKAFEKEIAEGEAYYKKNADEKKVDKISKLDLEKLKDDAFLKWNKKKDEANKNFADKLGFIKDIDKPKAEEKKDDPSPEPAATPDGISAWGAKVDDGIKISWSVKNMSTSSGFKIVYSKDTTSPVYPGNSYKYISNPSARSVVLGLTDGKTYHVRVCAYRPESDVKCAAYSNTVSVTAPNVPKEVVDSGSVTLSSIAADGSFSWTITGTSPYGYKIAYGTTADPEYPGRDDKDDKYIYISNESTKSSQLPGDLASGTYYVRVCKYNAYYSPRCIVYSNPQTFTKQ